MEKESLAIYIKAARLLQSRATNYRREAKPYREALPSVLQDKA